MYFPCHPFLGHSFAFFSNMIHQFTLRLPESYYKDHEYCSRLRHGRT
jgi:hypothetical protein